MIRRTRFNFILYCLALLSAPAWAQSPGEPGSNPGPALEAPNGLKPEAVAEPPLKVEFEEVKQKPLPKPKLHPKPKPRPKLKSRLKPKLQTSKRKKQNHAAPAVAPVPPSAPPVAPPSAPPAASVVPAPKGKLPHTFFPEIEGLPRQAIYVGILLLAYLLPLLLYSGLLRLMRPGAAAGLLMLLSALVCLPLFLLLMAETLPGGPLPWWNQQENFLRAGLLVLPLLLAGLLAGRSKG